jgi:hypothetical protein
MKEYFALEIYEMSKHAPPRIWYRSDLYPTREKAKKAFLDLETYEAFAALDCIQGAEDPPFPFDGEYENVDDYAKAYEDGVPEVVEIINNLLAWVNEEKGEWIESHWVEHGIQNFNVHEDPTEQKEERKVKTAEEWIEWARTTCIHWDNGDTRVMYMLSDQCEKLEQELEAERQKKTKKIKICKDTNHHAKLKLIYQSLQNLVDDTAEYQKLAKKGARELKDYAVMADTLLELRTWAIGWLKQNKEFKK